jgi:hypothetical protein
MRQMLRTLTRLLGPVGAVLVLAGATGCGGTGTITGKVTYQGRPLTGGTVLFTSASGKGSQSSPIGPDGSYTIEKMPTGPAKVAVDTGGSAQRPPGVFGGGPPKQMQPGKDVKLPEGVKSPLYNPEAKQGKPPERIPEQYANPDTSKLTYTVRSGSQTHEIELK